MVNKNILKILIFDFNPISGLADSLKDILESSQKMKIILRQEHCRVSRISHLSTAVSYFSPDIIFFILSSINLKQHSVIIHDLLKKSDGELNIFVIEGSNTDEITDLLKLGFTDFLTTPLKPIDVLPRLWRLLEQKSNSNKHPQTLKKSMGIQQLIGKTASFLAEIQKIPTIASCDACVMISGETGTGKEMCAQAIHYHSPRSSKSFIPINCGAIPMELLENELFGHVKGAFTGASKVYPGLIHEANGGTLFLDEIDCLPLMAQVKLLRFLQDKEYRQLGSSKTLTADVRIIASSNIDLKEAVSDGRFRQDLFYRINTIPLMLPPLRERKEDIPLLAMHFLAKYSPALKKQLNGFTPSALKLLLEYEWPGNVRELENIIERSAIFAKENLVRSSDIILPQSKPLRYQESFNSAKSRVIAQFEKSYIQSLLLIHNGNITKAANTAKKNRRAFWELIRKNNIDVQNFKSGPL